MPFDLASAKPVSGGFDLATARPVEDRSNEIPKLNEPERIPAPKQSFLEKVGETMKGAPEALATAATGTAGQFTGNLAGAARAVTSGKFGTAEGIDEGMKRADTVAEGMTHQPKGEAAQGTLQRVGDILKPLEGLPPHVALPSAGKGAGKVASAAEGGLQRTAAGIVDPDRAALARRAQEFGISIRPDMLTDNRFVRMMGEALDKVPLSGSKSEQRTVAFNRALMGQIGVDISASGEKRLTPVVFDAAMTKSGSAIGDIAARTPVPLEGFSQKLTEFVSEADRYQPSDIAKAVTNYADELKRAAAANGGVIPGETFRKIDSKLGRQWRATSNGDLKFALGDLQEVMHDALESNLKPQDSAALKEARRQYAIGKTLEPLVAKSKNGDMSPAGLMQAMTADKGKKTMMARDRGGAMGDLARIGQMFLKEPDSSGTTERYAAYGALGAGAHFEPHTAAGVYGAANLYNRAGPGVSKWLLDGTPEALRPPMSEALTP